MSETQFQGWLGKDAKSVGNLEWGSFEPKKWTEDDVDIEVSHCGICGTDLHMLKSAWGPIPYRMSTPTFLSHKLPFPPPSHLLLCRSFALLIRQRLPSACVVGHEIVGKAVKVGSNVKHIEVGDRVGVGAQARSCLEKDCPDCSLGYVNHCRRAPVTTYGSVYPNGEGKSYGGYATHNRTNANFVVPIPAGLASADAAPMMCGGITIFSPLKQNHCGPGKTVGIVGVGGIGHFGVLFAKALGADRVVGISRKADKRDDVLQLGADLYIATDEDEDWATNNAQTLDLIVCTVSSDKMPLDGYLQLLKTKGTFIQVGLPDGGILPPINALTLVVGGIKIGGSATGSPAEIAEMLQLAAEKKIKPWIQERPMKEANQSIVDMEAGKARYRYVLVN